MTTMRPQAGVQEMFINIKDDGLDENGNVIGEGNEIDFIFYGGGGGKIKAATLA